MIARHRTPASVIDRSFDRTFDQLTSSLFTPVRRGPEVLASWDADTLVLTVDLPGVSAEQVSVETAGRTLTLAAERVGAPGRIKIPAIKIPAMEIPASESAAAQEDTQSSPTNSMGSQ